MSLEFVHTTPFTEWTPEQMETAGAYLRDQGVTAADGSDILPLLAVAPDESAAQPGISNFAHLTLSGLAGDALGIDRSSFRHGRTVSYEPTPDNPYGNAIYSPPPNTLAPTVTQPGMFSPVPQQTNPQFDTTSPQFIANLTQQMQTPGTDANAQLAALMEQRQQNFGAAFAEQLSAGDPNALAAFEAGVLANPGMLTSQEGFDASAFNDDFIAAGSPGGVGSFEGQFMATPEFATALSNDLEASQGDIDFGDVENWFWGVHRLFATDPQAYLQWAQENPAWATRFHAMAARGTEGGQMVRAGPGVVIETEESIAYPTNADNWNNDWTLDEHEQMAQFLAYGMGQDAGYGSDGIQDGSAFVYGWDEDVWQDVNNERGVGDFFKIGTPGSVNDGFGLYLEDNWAPLLARAIVAAGTGGASAGAEGVTWGDIIVNFGQEAVRGYSNDDGTSVDGQFDLPPWLVGQTPGQTETPPLDADNPLPPISEQPAPAPADPSDGGGGGTTGGGGGDEHPGQPGEPPPSDGNSTVDPDVEEGAADEGDNEGWNPPRPDSNGWIEPTIPTPPNRADWPETVPEWGHSNPDGSMVVLTRDGEIMVIEEAQGEGDDDTDIDDIFQPTIPGMSNDPSINPGGGVDFGPLPPSANPGVDFGPLPPGTGSGGGTGGGNGSGDGDGDGDGDGPDGDYGLGSGEFLMGGGGFSYESGDLFDYTRISPSARAILVPMINQLER